MNRKKILIFDAYGTILNTKNGSVEATRKILQKNHSQLDPESFYKRWKRAHKEILTSQTEFKLQSEIFRISLRRLYRQFGILGNPDEDISIMLDTLGNRDAFPEVSRVFRELKKDYLIVVGSNSDTDPLMRDITRNKIHVDEVITSESVNAYKPAKGFYHSIMKKFPGVPIEDFAFIGDSEVEDIIAPRGIGMRTVWVNRMGTRWQHEVEPHGMIASMDELQSSLCGIF